MKSRHKLFQIQFVLFKHVFFRQVIWICLKFGFLLYISGLCPWVQWPTKPYWLKMCRAQSKDLDLKYLSTALKWQIDSLRGIKMFHVLYFLFTLFNLIKEGREEAEEEISEAVAPQSFGKWGCAAAAVVTVRSRCWNPVQESFMLLSPARIGFVLASWSWKMISNLHSYFC